MLGPVHTSHFCRVEFNSIKCGRNETIDSGVVLVSHLIQNWYCRVCRPAEKVLNAEYSIWRTNILSGEGLKFCEKLSANGTRRRRLTMQQYVLQYVKVALRQKWPSFFFFFGGTKFTHAPYINIMYELDSTRQKFDVWIGVAFLLDNATRPVERAAEMRQPIQTSNFCRI